MGNGYHKRPRQEPPKPDAVLRAVWECAGQRQRRSGDGLITIPGGCTSDLTRHLGTTHPIGHILRSLEAEGRVTVHVVGPYRCYLPTGEPKGAARVG